MMFRKSLLAAVAIPLLWAAAPPIAAQDLEATVEADILPGWRRADGTHVAAVRLKLKDGWKTYWRSPGDGGIPPRLTWSGSRNVRTLDPMWPTPIVFIQSGLRSVGYTHEVVVPVIIEPRRNGKDISLNGRLEIGVCKDICIPETLHVEARLPKSVNKIDPRIAVALSDQPYSAEEARVKDISCDIEATADGMRISAVIDMPSPGGKEFGIIETDNPLLWVAEAETKRTGSRLRVSSEVLHVEEKPFLLNRSGLRVTVLGQNYAVEVSGCSVN